MKASRTDQPRTRPVALRTNRDCSPRGASPATDAMVPSLLSAREDEALDLLLAVDLDDAALAELDVRRFRDDLVHLELVVVPGAAEAADARSLQPFGGEAHPLIDRLEHLVLEEVVPALLVRLQLP